MATSEISERPWGRFETLYQTRTAWMKRLIIDPGHYLSYQYHLQRTEYWYPESGDVWAEIEGNKIMLLPDYQATIIYPRVKHRLYNPGDEPVSVLEWSVGLPQENDIVRLEDNYGRA